MLLEERNIISFVNNLFTHSLNNGEKIVHCSLMYELFNFQYNIHVLSLELSIRIVR